MTILEQKTYPTKELAALLGMSSEKHLSDVVQKALKRMGYSCKPSYGKITITALPPEPDELTRMLNKYFPSSKYNERDEETFQMFVALMVYEPLFQTMPWSERVKMLYEDYGLSVSEKTLQRRMKDLIDKYWGHKTKDKNQLWHTFVNRQGQKEREPVLTAEQLAKSEKWFKYRSKLEEEAGNLAYKMIWDRTQELYYYPNTFELSAFNMGSEEENFEMKKFFHACGEILNEKRKK